MPSAILAGITALLLQPAQLVMLNQVVISGAIAHNAIRPVIGMHLILIQVLRSPELIPVWPAPNAIQTAVIQGYRKTARPVMLNHPVILVPTVHLATPPTIGMRPILIPDSH